MARHRLSPSHTRQPPYGDPLGGRRAALGPPPAAHRRRGRRGTPSGCTRCCSTWQRMAAPPPRRTAGSSSCPVQGPPQLGLLWLAHRPDFHCLSRVGDAYIQLRQTSASQNIFARNRRSGSARQATECRPIFLTRAFWSRLAYQRTVTAHYATQRIQYYAPLRAVPHLSSGVARLVWRPPMDCLPTTESSEAPMGCGSGRVSSDLCL